MPGESTLRELEDTFILSPRRKPGPRRAGKNWIPAFAGMTTRRVAMRRSNDAGLVIEIGK
jgi:hypothetical protein